MLSTTPDLPSFKQFELRGWEGCVDAYDSSFTPLTLQAGERLASRLGITDGLTALDMACGPGQLTASLVAKGARVIGADFSPNMIERALKHHPHVQFQVQDAESLSFADNSFDIVTMNFGVLHLESPERATAESARVLKPGGGYGFTVWAPPTEALGFSIVLKAIEQHGDSNVKLPAGPPFFKFSDPAAAEDLLRSAGFTDISSEKAPLAWNLTSPDEFFRAFYHGTARTGGLLRAQPEENLQRIRDAVLARVLNECGTGNGDNLEIPMPAMLYWAKKFS